MDKEQAIYHFWKSFDWNAYDETTVPEDAQFPYITYATMTDSIGYKLTLTASLWDRGTSWERLAEKVKQISQSITGDPIRINGGYLWVTKGSPFAQRMGDDSDDMIRRVLLMIQAEFLAN